MGRHDKHLPARKFLNKTVGHGTQPADSKTLQRLSRGQGGTTKEDAKAAKHEDTDNTKAK
jgi:hypothetical protein